MTIDRAEETLTDSTLANEVDTVLRRTSNGYRASSSRGSADFIRHDDDSIEVVATSGANPLGDERTDQRTAVDDETANPWATLGDHATPLAMASARPRHSPVFPVVISFLR